MKFTEDKLKKTFAQLLEQKVFKHKLLKYVDKRTK